jgi:hypothetical protein
MPVGLKTPKARLAKCEVSAPSFETHTDHQVETSRVSASIVEPEALDSSRRIASEHARPGQKLRSRCWPEI